MKLEEVRKEIDAIDRQLLPHVFEAYGLRKTGGRD